jgi:hypothetical protein
MADEKSTRIDSRENAAATTPATIEAEAAAAAADESVKATANNLTDLIDLTMTIHTTHKVNVVKILTFEINVPKEGSQWSRYRKNVARNKIKYSLKNKNTNTDKNVRNEGKAKLSNSVACVHTVERTWGVSSISFIAAVDRNGKTRSDFF